MCVYHCIKPPKSMYMYMICIYIVSKNIVYINIACFLFKKLRTVLVQESQIVGTWKRSPEVTVRSLESRAPTKAERWRWHKINWAWWWWKMVDRWWRRWRRWRSRWWWWWWWWWLLFLLSWLWLHYHDDDYINIATTTLTSQRRRWRQPQWRPYVCVFIGRGECLRYRFALEDDLGESSGMVELSSLFLFFFARLQRQAQRYEKEAERAEVEAATWQNPTN